MKVALASDHAGFAVKEKVKDVLRELGIEFEDLGSFSDNSVDYPDFAIKVTGKVVDGAADQGLLVCGSGTGMAIAANKVKGIRAAVGFSEQAARLAREHNDANVLTIGSRTTSLEEIPAIIRAWFSSSFQSGRHKERVDKIKQIEDSWSKD
jgi:ribose 5-phosphate isomerase B